jgi:NAD(P)-dependent dehydrogenase (short-subunit alcohol dehydrogenase family)/acyl carrier protein
VAYRGKVRWEKGYERLKVSARGGAAEELRQGSVFLITGGMEGIAYAVAEHLADSIQAKLCIIDDGLYPPRDHWSQWLARHDGHDAVSRKMKKAQALEALGAEVLIFKASVADPAEMKSVIAQIYERFGELNGVIYGSEDLATDMFRPIEEITHEQSEHLFESKVYGLYVLDEVLQNAPLDFCLFISSLASVLGGPGYAAYAAANTFIDHFCNGSRRKSSANWISVNCDSWSLDKKSATTIISDSDNHAMTVQEGVEAFRRIISRAASGQVIVSTGDLSQRASQWITHAGARAGAWRKSDDEAALHPRPALSNSYTPPTTELERAITDIWQKALGIEPIGLYDNFFDLGGDSLMALQVISDLKKGLKQNIPVVSLYERLTIRSLAELLKSSQEVEESAPAQSAEREERMLRRKQFQQKERTRKRQANS